MCRPCRDIQSMKMSNRPMCLQLVGGRGLPIRWWVIRLGGVDSRATKGGSGWVGWAWSIMERLSNNRTAGFSNRHKTHFLEELDQMGLNSMKLLQAAISICWTALWVLKLWEACMQHPNEKVSSATSRPIVSTASSPRWTARRRDFFKRKIYSCKPQSEKAKMWINKIKCTFCRLTKSSSIKIIWERDWMMRRTNCNKVTIAHPTTGDQTATTCKCQWRIIVLYSIRESQAIPELDCEISTLIWKSLALLTTTSTTPRSQA